MLLSFLGLQVVAPCLGLGFVRMGEAVAANLGPQGAFRRGVLLPPEPLTGRGRNFVAATAGAEHRDRLTGFRDSVNGYTKIALDRKRVYKYTESMNNTNKAIAEKLVAKRVAGGANAEQSRKMLADLISDFSPKNLAYALAYNSFSTARSCDNDAAELLAEAR